MTLPPINMELPAAERVLAAAEILLVSSVELESISVRRIAALAEVPASTISYYFGSREKLLFESVRAIYRRFNSERLQLLNAAVLAADPAPADLASVIDALVGPSVRWSLDPKSSYKAFINLTALNRPPRDPQVQHLRPFIAVLKRIAPHLSDAEIGLRIHASLGIRSSMIRDRDRLKALTGDGLDISSPKQVLTLMIGMIAPMFA